MAKDSLRQEFRLEGAWQRHGHRAALRHATAGMVAGLAECLWIP